jgi:hypothetical protein
MTRQRLQLTGGLVALILFSVACGGGRGPNVFGPPDLSGEKPDFTGTAKDLAKEFSDNQAAAKAKYDGKIVEVTGKVTALEWDNNRRIALVGLDVDDLGNIVFPCRMADPEPWAQLSQGAQARIKGRWAVEEVGFRCILTDATVVAPQANDAPLITAKDLIAAMKADPVQTNAKYDGKRLIVEGEIVAKQARKEDGRYLIDLNGGDMKIRCSFQKENNSLGDGLQVGQKVRMYGEYIKDFQTEPGVITLGLCLPITKGVK